MYDEEDCIYYENKITCKNENKKECCGICKDKITVKKKQTLKITEYDPKTNETNIKIYGNI